MKKFKLIALSALVCSCAWPAFAAEPSCKTAAATKAEGVTTLSSSETAAGWKLLWDGKTSEGWTSVRSQTFPETGWVMCNGVLTILEKGGEESQGPGDIITRKRYENFELKLEFAITPGANSGVKIFAQTDISPIDRFTGKPVKVGSGIGLEFQVLDDDRHPDAKLGRDGNRTIGSFYDVIPADKGKKVMPVGQWNQARIVAKGKTVTYWLNGVKTVEFTRGSPAYLAAVGDSKFKNLTGFGEWQDGHILLQDHGNTVSFRNIKILERP